MLARNDQVRVGAVPPCLCRADNRWKGSACGSARFAIRFVRFQRLAFFNDGLAISCGVLVAGLGEAPVKVAVRCHAPVAIRGWPGA